MPDGSFIASHLRPMAKYFNYKAIGELPLLAVFYRCAAPLVWGAFRLGLTANQVTLWALLAGVGSFFALLLGSVPFFIALWLVSFTLDFVDGPLARLTGSAQKFVVRKDHLSDLFRISLIPAGFGFFHDNQVVWMSAFLSTFGFLFYSVVNDAVGKGSPAETPQRQRLPKQDVRTGFTSRMFVEDSPAWRIFRPLFIIHSHTFLLYFLVPFSSLAASVLLTYIGLLSFAHAARIIWKSRSVVELA